MKPSDRILGFLEKIDIENETNDEWQQSPEFRQLTKWISDLILNDFQKLIQILYRIDVSETRLKEVFSKRTDIDSTASDIAILMVEREIQKRKFRKYFGSK